MPVVKKTETLPPQPIILLIFGEGGLSKTSLSSTAKNPFNIDFDRGLKRSFGKPDALILENGWREVEQEFAAGTFSAYDTIVIDTAKGALDDFLMNYVMEQDYKLKTNKLKMFGAIGEEFKSFVNRLRDQNKDIIIIAHAKTEQEGDIIKRMPDVTGQSSQLLLRIADQVGHVSMRNGKRVISFNPTDTVVGKNVGALPDLEFPHYETPAWKHFCDREIIQKVKESLSRMSDEQREAIEFIETQRATIDALTGGNEELTAAFNAVKAIPEQHLQKQVVAYFSAHLKSIGWKWDKETSQFIDTKAAQPTDTNVGQSEPKTEPVDLFAAEEK